MKDLLATIVAAVVSVVASLAGSVGLFRWLARRERARVERERVRLEHEDKREERIDDTQRFLLEKTQEQLDKREVLLDKREELLDQMRKQIAELVDNLFASEARQRQLEHDLRLALRKIEEQSQAIEKHRVKIAELEVQVEQMKLLGEYAAADSIRPVKGVRQ